MRPFSSGSQYEVWSEYNCSRCKLGWKSDDVGFQCSLEEELLVAYYGTGHISDETAQRTGLAAGNYDCPERVAE